MYMKNVLYKYIASTPTKPQRVYIGRKSGIIITRNHSETSIIKMKHHLVVPFGKLTMRLNKYHHLYISTYTNISIVKTVPAYSNTSKKCALCLHEKLKILMYSDPEEPLNKRSMIKYVINISKPATNHK